MTFGLFSQMDIHIPLTTGFLMTLLSAMLAIWLIHMIIVRYHWNNYGNDDLKVVKMNIIYFIGSAILFATMALFIVLYGASISTL